MKESIDDVRQSNVFCPLLPKGDLLRTLTHRIFACSLRPLSDPTESFRLARRINEVLSSYGVNANIATDESLTRLHSQNADTQEKVLLSLRRYLDILEMAQVNQIDISNSKALLQLVEKKWSVRFSDGFIDEIDNGDILEIYDSEFSQIFRNHRFLEICGYDLLTVEMGQWPELFERDQKITESLIQMAVQMLESGVETYRFESPPHLMKERNSETRQVVEVTHRLAAPIFDEEQNRLGFAVTQSAKIVSPFTEDGQFNFINRSKS